MSKIQFGNLRSSLLTLARLVFFCVKMSEECCANAEYGALFLVGFVSLNKKEGWSLVSIARRISNEMQHWVRPMSIATLFLPRNNFITRSHLIPMKFYISTFYLHSSTKNQVRLSSKRGRNESLKIGVIAFSVAASCQFRRNSILACENWETETLFFFRAGLNLNCRF